MELYEIYKKIRLDEFWNDLEEQLLNEAGEDPGLVNLLNQANKVVFDKFKIDPKEKKYFIAGSARLYLYSDLRKIFGLNNIGDIDIVIPYKQLWVQANLLNAWNNGGVYRPTKHIEVFNLWVPAKSGQQYADTNVRDTMTILRDASFIKGYYFMHIRDIIDYKLKLNREKEAAIVDLVNKFMHSEKNKIQILKYIIKTIGKEQTRQLFS